MYDYIKGTLVSLTPTNAVVETCGVGYFLNISLQTFSEIEGASDVKLFVHQYIVQNDAPLFYGFATTAEREMFRLLISVSGIGANTARVMLSSFSTAELAVALATGNVAAIKSVKGIGVKTAERAIVELKGKVVNFSTEEPTNQQFVPADKSTSISEATEALLVLGFAKANVEKVCRAIFSEKPSASSEEIIRTALGRL